MLYLMFCINQNKTAIIIQKVDLNKMFNFVISSLSSPHLQQTCWFYRGTSFCHFDLSQLWFLLDLFFVLTDLAMREEPHHFSQSSNLLQPIKKVQKDNSEIL